MKAHKAKTGMYVYLKMLFDGDVQKGYVLGDAVVILRHGRKHFVAADGNSFLWKQVTPNPRKVHKRQYKKH